MRFGFGNREKMVIGGILTILLIAGMHLTVFSNKAKQYEEIVREWGKSKQDYEDLVQKAKNPKIIENFQAKNKKYQEEFKTIVKELNIDFPGHYLDPKPESIQKRREETIQHIEELIELKKAAQNVKLSFMDDKGWNIPLELPEDIRKRPERLWDIISQINGINSILKVIDNPQVRVQKLVQYGELLKEIGMDEVKIDGLKGYGPYVPFINRYCHYRLIIKEKPKDIKLTDVEIQDIIRMTFPDDFLIKLNHQLYALTDLVKIAEKNKLEDITEVVLNDFTEIRSVVKPEETPEGQPAAPTPPVRERGMDDRFFEEEAMGGISGMSFSGKSVASKGAHPTTLLGDFLGHGAPIRFRFTGSNLNVTNFLYEVTHLPRTYELDSLSVSTIKEREGVEDVYAWINVIALVEGILVDLDTIWKEPEKKPVGAPPTGG
ncbi:hypothetical protein JW926_05310 [Candidatus Sumerlaeota bacterium]|nr:hypothetical protein [Candidatus Sumerlaeota bacterium]